MRAGNSPVANLYYLTGSRPQISPLIFKSSCHPKEKPALNVCRLCPALWGALIAGETTFLLSDFGRTQNLLHFFTVPWNTSSKAEKVMMDRLQNKFCEVCFMKKLIQLFFAFYFFPPTPTKAGLRVATWKPCCIFL